MDDAARRASLEREYAEVSSLFKTLTDIRFKLLGLVPAATIASVIAVGAKPEALSSVGFVVSLFGLVVVLGVITYNVRNDQLYDELVGRAADIERRLGIRDGAFGSRPRDWLRVGWRMNHGNALMLIYGATVALWLTGVLAPLVELARRAYLEITGHAPLSPFGDVQAGVILVAGAIAVCITLAACAWAANHREKQVKALRRAAVEAMAYARNGRLSAASAASDDAFLGLCEKLRGAEPLDRRDEAADALAKPRRRARFLAASAHADLYVPPATDSDFPAYLIASLCDLPPRWLLDTESGRRA